MKNYPKYMNKYYIILILFSLSCSKQDKTSSNKLTENIVSKIVVKYQDLDIETPIRIDCDSLESYFQENIGSMEITNKDKINKILSLLKQCSANEKSEISNIDVRYKINLYYSNKQIEYVCGNRVLINIKGIVYKVDYNSLKLINTLLEDSNGTK